MCPILSQCSLSSASLIRRVKMPYCNICPGCSCITEIAPSDLAIKSLGAISVMHEQPGQMLQYGIFTRRISDAELKEHCDKIGHMPTLFQDFIEKESELRITCVGDQAFACEIQARLG